MKPVIVIGLVLACGALSACGGDDSDNSPVAPAITQSPAGGPIAQEKRVTMRVTPETVESEPLPAKTSLLVKLEPKGLEPDTRVDFAQGGEDIAVAILSDADVFVVLNDLQPGSLTVRVGEKASSIQVR